MEATSSCCVSALPNSLASVTTSYAETALLATEASTTRSSKVENNFCHSLLPNDEVLERFSTSIHQRDSDKLVDEVMCVVRRSMEQQASINNHANISTASSSNTNANYISDFHYTYDNSKCNSASEMWEQDSRCTRYVEDNLPLPVRLSRHIPQRDEMNMAISSFNLLQPTNTPVESFSAHHTKRTGPPFSSSASSSLVYSVMRSQQKEQEQNDHHHHHNNHHHHQQEQHQQTNLSSRMSLSAPVSPSTSITGPFANTNNINKLEMLSFTTSPLQSPEKTNQMEVQKCVNNNNNNVTRNTTNPESSSSSSSPPTISATTQTNKNHHSSDKSILSLSHLASYRRQMNHNKRPKSVSLTAGFAGVCLSQPVMSSKQRRARDASHSSFTPPSSECTSLVESFISDDSSHLTSLYNEMLVDHLNSSSTTSNTTKIKYSNSNGIEHNVSEVRSCQHEHNKRRVESCHSPSNNNNNENYMPSRTIDDNETDNVEGVSTTTSSTTSFTTSTLTNDNGVKVNDLPLTRAHLDGMHLHSTITDQNDKLCHCEEESNYKNTSCTSSRNLLKLQIYHGNETREREKEEKVESEEEEEEEDENDEDVNILSQHHRRRRKERCNGPNRVGGNVFAFSPN